MRAGFRERVVVDSCIYPYHNTEFFLTASVEDAGQQMIITPTTFFYPTAIIDLNGRFFGGRQVKAGFYDHENFKAYRLNEKCD